jgi:hypothetical protein
MICDIPQPLKLFFMFTLDKIISLFLGFLWSLFLTVVIKVSGPLYASLIIIIFYSYLYYFQKKMKVRYQFDATFVWFGTAIFAILFIIYTYFAKIPLF